MRIAIIVLALCYIACVVAETPVQQCANVKAGDYTQVITVGRCQKPPCRLRKKTTVAVEFKFTAGRDVEKISNNVQALIVGLPLPFIGVDGTSACEQIFEPDGTTKAACPLKAGKEYVFKNNIKVEDFYPRLKLTVHWALTGSDGKDVMCFEVPARITN